MEYFDLVNEKDEVIGVTTKDKSHKDDQLHRVAAIFVFDKNGDLYMQEHLLHDRKYDHAVGGHVRQGESYDEAAIREGFEELGLRDRLHKICIFHPTQVFSGFKNNHFYGLYEVTPSKDWEFIPNDEVDIIIHMPLHEIVAMMNATPEKFVKGFIYTMKEYIKQKKLPYAITVI